MVGACVGTLILPTQRRGIVFDGLRSDIVCGCQGLLMPSMSILLYSFAFDSLLVHRRSLGHRGVPKRLQKTISHTTKARLQPLRQLPGSSWPQAMPTHGLRPHSHSTLTAFTLPRRKHRTRQA